jgi:hypothetical protein
MTPGEHTKRIVFTEALIEQIQGRAEVTYRKFKLNGLYHLASSRFKREEANAPVIYVYRTEEIDPYILTDDDAKLAGVESAEEIRRLFESWYGKPIPHLYRNWFRLVVDTEK